MGAFFEIQTIVWLCLTGTDYAGLVSPGASASVPDLGWQE
jgi:hypothetical protein